MLARTWWMFVLATTGLGGCATLPTMQTERGINVDQIVDTTKCELASVVKNPRFAKEMNKWSAKVSLDLTVLYDNSGGPGGALVVPYHAGTVEVSADLAAGAKSNRVGHLAYNVAALGELRGLACPESSGIPYAPDRLGLAQWLERAVGSVTKPYDFVDLDELSYTLEFVIERSASGDIRIKAAGTPTTGSWGAGGRASAKDTNTLVVSLVRPKKTPPKPDPTEVVILSWPPVPKGAQTFSEQSAPERPTRRPTPPPRGAVIGRRTVDPETQERLDSLHARQRLFNSITIPRNNLGL